MFRLRLPFALALALAAAFLAPRFSAADDPHRPKVLGVAHVAFYVSDLEKTRAFYKDFLGFDEPFSLQRPDGTTQMAFIKINDYQFVELSTDKPKADNRDGQLSHISLYTDDAAAMRDYLNARGVAAPAVIPKGRSGNFNYNVKDADNHTVEIVQYLPDSWSGQNRGKSIPATRISDHIAHAGVLVRSLDAANKFYAGILGFQEFWRGNPANAKTLSWVNMRVPDGRDYIELMLYDKPQSADETGTKNHISLTVPDAEKAVAILKQRAAKVGYTREIVAKTGVNRKRQVNLYDPDGSRVELMEPDTVDGQPAPSSTLAPPQ